MHKNDLFYCKKIERWCDKNGSFELNFTNKKDASKYQKDILKVSLDFIQFRLQEVAQAAPQI